MEKDAKGLQSRRPGCAQCGRPAIVAVDDLPLCVDCHYKFQQTQYMQFAQTITMLNHASNEMALISGMPHLNNQVAIPPPPVPPIHYNNQSISVSGGQVGAINFGSVNDIQVELRTVVETAGPQMADALADLTNAILGDAAADVAAKNDLLDQIAFLTKQAAAAPSERKPGLLKSVIGGVQQGVAMIGSAADAWSKVEPLLRGHFQI